MQDLIVQRPEGLYCPPGDFYIDPWRPVDRAVITHAHADHARVGHGHYLAARAGEGVLRARLGGITLQSVDYGEAVVHHGVRISLHPAGHVLGSAQVRLEHQGQVWVASGDYKVAPDPTCALFEPVRCDTFITESTFGLPVYRWPSDETLFADMNAWWAANAAAGRASVLACYSFGKAQRVLAGVDPSIGPLVVHGAVEPINQAYRAAGVALPRTQRVADVPGRYARGTRSAPSARDSHDGPGAQKAWRGALVVCPPSAVSSPWLRRFGEASLAFASGWMQLRGARRRGGWDRGFVLSDHADWPGLQSAIAATGASRVIVTHGQVPVMVRYLAERGLRAEAFETAYGDEAETAAEMGAQKVGPQEGDTDASGASGSSGEAGPA